MHRANKRVAIKRQRQIESHWGDVYGDPMPLAPMRLSRTPVDVVAVIKSSVCALAGFILASLVTMALLFVALTTTSRPAATQQIVTEKQVRDDCTRDALRHCPIEAMACLKSETPQCRSAVIGCMLEHKSKLRPKCSRHFY